MRRPILRTPLLVLAMLMGACTAAALAHGAATSDAALERSLRKEVDRFVAEDVRSPPTPCQVLFVGSSSIVKWRDHLAEDMVPLPVINRGFGGSHIEFVDEWFDELVKPYHPRAIVLYAGENDLDAGKPVQRVVADFDAFMARKTQALGDTPVYFIALKPSKLRFVQFLSQSAVNDAVKERAQRRGDLHFIDVVPYMLDHGRPKDIYESDGLHMTREGYLIWKPLVRAALMKDTESQQVACRKRR